MVLENQVALITGAGRGIGKGIAQRLSRAGASIVVVDIDGDAAGQAADEIKAEAGVETSSLCCDVSDMDQVAAVVDETVKAYGRIDILVNNAGITRDTLIMRMKPGDWDLVIRINLTGTFNFIRAACRPMTRQRSGAIVNISSVVGLTGNPGQANYSASKAGILGLTKSAAKEFASRGVR
ncbi:MAG: SDR family NAD(P)-dependent oxidoreductase, partial [Gemmatimonadota bacterium]|nr:SDR family NAD(P)-dependent oxidoreductase [Gemmatimonadota bacterium]